MILHLDAALILLPVCRNFVSVVRRTSIGTVIPFDKNITLHKATGWSICIWSFVHIAAHMVNFYKLAMTDKASTGERIVAFLAANFITGPGTSSASGTRTTSSSSSSSTGSSTACSA
jgi:hypothetical protein